jgi:acetolactate synthase-1/2/3 large subunit
VLIPSHDAHAAFVHAGGERHVDAPEERTGAQIMCDALVREGVDLLFGIPGGAIMPFYHALWEYRGRLRHVLCRHEQGAGHAAEGYARATGKVGVCVGTSGPGATNLVTPIADAWMDSTPMVILTGQVSSLLLGTNAFQEVDITGITLPITKHNYLVSDIAELPHVMREAFYLARSGRPGPVLVDVTKDCQQARGIPDWNTELDLPLRRPMPTAPDAIIERAASLLAHARKPLLLVGNGIIQGGASERLLAFAELTGIPVITTLHGLGAFPETHPLSLGMPGMHGAVHVNRAIQACDVLLTIGARFDDRVTGRADTFARKARVIHVDIDAAEIGKLIRTEVGIVGDAARVIEQLGDALRKRGRRAPEAHAGWLAEIRGVETERRKSRRLPSVPQAHALSPHDVYAALNDVINSDDERERYRVVTDVGQHQMWAAQSIAWHRPRSHITSGGAGTMGFAVPAALGVALACPAETVWVICGDGGFQMTNQELATVSQEGVANLKVLVINNGYLGMVRQWQELFNGKRYSETQLSAPNFARLAEAYGWTAITVDHVSDVRRALDTAATTPGPVLIDFRVAQDVNVFPLVPPGESIGTMLTEA